MSDTRLIPLSALQHYDFCPRQCALIHNEQIWAENYLTAQGQLLHERVDGGEPETRKGIRYERGVAVSVPKLGLTGKLDLIEHELASGNYLPVEYKRGRPKVADCDRIQLCAQGLCLEEMLSRPVGKGALWYWQTRHREVINFDDALRQKTLQIIASVRSLFISGETPKAKFEKKCKACSLLDLCNPSVTGNDKSRAYAQALFNLDGLSDEEVAK